MHRLAIALLSLIPMAPAQVVVAPNELARMKLLFEPRAGEEPLRCEATPVAPTLNFAFRFRAGYILHVPQSQYPASTRGWVVLTAIAPEEGDATYLFARVPFSSASKTDLNFEIRGSYFLGVGRYTVESTLLDDRKRVCRKQWRVVVEPSRANRSVPLAMLPNAVLEYSAAAEPDTRLRDSPAATRLSILVNAAAFSTRTVIRPHDRAVLLGALTALLEHLSAASVRLVVFSLEQQREVFRAENFSPPDLMKAADAIRSVEQTTVDVHVLEKPLGHVDFLAGLIGRERDTLNPADTIVFLGPTSRYGNKIPEAVLPTPREAIPRFFYVRYEIPRRPSLTSDGTGLEASPFPAPRIPSRLPSADSTQSRGTPTGPPSMMPASGGQTDIIAAAVARLKGKTLAIRTPADLAGAIRKIEEKR